MKNVLSCATFVACLLVSAVVLAEQSAAVKVTPIKDGLFLLSGKGGNVVASVGSDGLLFIDDDYADMAQAYSGSLGQLTPDAVAPRYIINTHWHSDHSGGNGYWAAKQSVIVAHDNVRLRMSTRQDMKALGMVAEPSPAGALPVITYGQSMALFFNNEELEIEHLAKGHTDGDSVVFFSKANVIHVGDLFFLDAFPFVDRDSGGDLAIYIANVASLLARCDNQTVIVPGHGHRVATKQDYQRFHDMMTATTAQVQASLKQGLSVDEIIQQGLGPQWDSWGKGFIKEDQWIRTIVASQ